MRRGVHRKCWDEKTTGEEPGAVTSIWARARAADQLPTPPRVRRPDSNNLRAIAQNAQKVHLLGRDDVIRCPGLLDALISAALPAHASRGIAMGRIHATLRMQFNVPCPMNRRHFLGSAIAAVAHMPLRAQTADVSEFEIGLVADAQYADIPAAGTRYYRESISRLAAAADHFQGRDLAFCAHLGDLIDRNWDSFTAIEQPLSQSRHQWHQVLGNHDFEVIDALKTKVPDRLRVPRRYRKFEYGAFDFLILDTNDVSTYAHAAGTPEHTVATTEFAAHVAALLPQAKPWNGGIGPTQLAWLDHHCGEARSRGRKVIVLAHHPILPVGSHNVWNAPAILRVIERHRNLVAWLNGHNHAGAFAMHEGVPFVTMRGMVETPDTTAFATAQIRPDRMIITGHGREPSRELIFRT